MISKKISLLTMMLVVLFTISSPVFAVELTVGSGSVTIQEGVTPMISVPVTVNDPTGIAGAAFTLEYNTNALDVVVSSTFFDSFASQFAGTQAPTSVDVDGHTYYQPLVSNDVSGTGTRIAAARAVAADDSSSTLFTLNISLKAEADPGMYPIQIAQTVLNNTTAGYSETGESIPYLVGALANEPDLSQAFPEISVSATNTGIVTFEGGVTENDNDGDGLPNEVETNTGTFVDSSNTGTDPDKADTDGDGYADGFEVNDASLDPLAADSPGGTGYNAANDTRTYGISGEISYEGTETGTLYVGVFADSTMDSELATMIEILSPSFPQAYTFTTLPARMDYFVAAYFDVGDNDPNEPGAEDPRGDLDVSISADMSGNNFEISIPTCIRGDADGSGSVDIFDALIVAEYDARIKTEEELDGFDCADVDYSGSVDIFDALKIAEFDAGLRPNLD